MTRIDHAAEARKHIDWAHEQQAEEGRFDETVQHNATLAVAEATLALAEQQRIANMQVEVSRLRVAANHRAGTQSGTDLSRQAHALEAQIAEGLGL